TSARRGGARASTTGSSAATTPSAATTSTRVPPRATPSTTTRAASSGSPRRRRRRSRRRAGASPTGSGTAARTSIRDMEPPQQGQYVAYTFYKVDPAWRRLPVDERRAGKDAFAEAVEDWSGRMG